MLSVPLVLDFRPRWSGNRASGRVIAERFGETMNVIPDSREDAILFCEQHLSAWQAHSAALGFLPATVTQLASLTTQARAKFNAAIAARQVSKTATNDYYVGVATMRNLASDMVKVIKAKAELDNNPNIFSLAQIPPPSSPTTQPAPGKPNNVNITLNPGGSVTLKWDSTSSTASSGVFFQVARRINSTSSPQQGFVGVGGTMTKQFTDETIPVGTDSVSYIIQGFRGDKPGTPSDQIVVQFGVGGLVGFAGSGDGQTSIGGNSSGNSGAAGQGQGGIGIAA
jgi:hypothetical protein